MTLVLAVEGGATKSVAGLYTPEGALLGEAEGGPCNPVACGLESTLAEFQGFLVRLLKDPYADVEVIVAAGVAGLFSNEWRAKLARALCRLPAVHRALVCDDFHPILAVNSGGGPAMLAIAGTGSKVAAQAADGREAEAGGRGVPFGEEGSAYQVAASALRDAARAVDGTGPATTLVGALPEAVGVADFQSLTAWANSAAKAELARLAAAVARCAESGDSVALRCVEAQAERLAAMAAAVRRRLDLPEGTPAFLIGGLFEHSGLYRSAFERALAHHVPFRVQVPALRGHRAVFELVRLNTSPDWLVDTAATNEGAPWHGHRARGQSWAGRPCHGSLPPTEQSPDSCITIDRMTSAEIVAAMHAADLEAVRAIGEQHAAVAAAIDAAARALQSGGRIIYVGAGTSGRLGVLDASECPPTFGVASDRVTAIIAGGDRALRDSVEGAEDDAARGADDLATLSPSPRDLVVGIAASGTTPYVRGALERARQAGARTVLLCCNPHIAADTAVDMVICLNTGVEVLEGSTRLKAGTATKLVLNMVSTGAMALAGYVYAGRMVRMRPANAKLRARAERIIAALGGVSPDRAATLLCEADDQIAVAVLMARKGLDADAAARLLEAHGGRLAAAIEA